MNGLRTLVDPSKVRLLDELVHSASLAIARLNVELNHSMFDLASGLDISEILPNWDVSQAILDMVAARQGAEALEDAGFGYSVAYWEAAFLRELAEADPDEAPVEVLQKLVSVSKSEAVEQELEARFGSPLLAKRWPAVREAFEDHRDERYHAAIATLLPLVEGVVCDILMLARRAMARKAITYKRSPDGSRGQKLSSLERKSKALRECSEVDAGLSDVILNQLAPDRNGILHGTEPSYGSAERSTHLVFVMLFLSVNARKIEEQYGRGRPLAVL